MQYTRASYVPRLISSEEELLTLPEDGLFREVWQSVLVCRDPAGSYHGAVEAELLYLLNEYVRRHQLGQVLPGDTGYVLMQDPLTVLAPDVSFISRNHWVNPPPKGFWQGAPDLAAEIRSPDQNLAELLAKSAAYIEAGSRLVWVIDPDGCVAWIMRPSQPTRQVTAAGYLDGDPVIPGFRCRLGALFPVDETSD